MNSDTLVPGGNSNLSSEPGLNPAILPYESGRAFRGGPIITVVDERACPPGCCEGEESPRTPTIAAPTSTKQDERDRESTGGYYDVVQLNVRLKCQSLRKPPGVTRDVTSAVLPV